MSINPIKFASSVNEQFLNYQLTAFPITDPDLSQQARELLRGGANPSPLLHGPYVSLSKSYKTSRDLRELAKEGFVHSALPGLTEYPVLFEHQWQTLKTAKDGKHCLVATGTGSGKTEAFLYPILDECLRMRDAGSPTGITAILVYPMNALANDQLERLRGMLAGSGINFGMYVGPTPKSTAELKKQLHKMRPDEGREAYSSYRAKYEKEKQDIIVSPFEERFTEQDMAEDPPRLLLTNVHQLEYLLTRGKDLGMFVDAPLKYLVFDEAHTYTGVRGAEVSCLIRRLRAFTRKDADEVTCIGTSATVADVKREEEAAQEAAEFAHRFFGVNQDNVRLVQEVYQDETFPEKRYTPAPPDGESTALLDAVLQALDLRNEKQIRSVVKQLTGYELSTQFNWETALYDALKSNNYVYEIYKRLERPAELLEVVQDVQMRIGRGHEITHHDQAELLAYLALGAAAERDGQPLLRPQVHYFAKGLEGAVIAFAKKDGEYKPNLFLSKQVAIDSYNYLPEGCPPVLICKTCGQHYLEGYYQNFEMEGRQPVGGTMYGDTAIWEPADEASGKRIVFTDRFISEIDDEEEGTRIERRRFEIYFCRYCGTLHLDQGRCHNPKCERPGDLVKVYGILLKDGRLTSCLSCNTIGGTIAGEKREPVKKLQAITVADVHILAQNMLNTVENPESRNLIVFSDNRQDAAFQAGWMRDHARRYRLRHLIYDFLRNKNEAVGIGEVVASLYKYFQDNPTIAKPLAPEVYETRSYDYFGTSLKETLTKFLRIIVLRELTTSFKHRESLENWGVMRIEYFQVNEENPKLQEIAAQYNLDVTELVDGISTLLDSFRRNQFFYDKEEPIYTKYWHESEEEIQHGFLPLTKKPPQGIKQYLTAEDNSTLIRGFMSERGQTLAHNYVLKWGIGEKQVQPLLNQLWGFLTTGDKPILPIVTLRGSRGTQLDNTRGARQVDSRAIGIKTQERRYRCNICRKIHTRLSPGNVCSGYHCSGTLIPDNLPEDDYNLNMLNSHFQTVQAAEHSGQVPAEIREQLEEEFKQQDGPINCLVATPTLELGVDIGDLDMILMRNVPPKPSNYWQRAGRAGRRHRMAVVYTYARRSDHDRYFFEEPIRMLGGKIETPQFNLRNEIMIRKHVHSTVISELLRLIQIVNSAETISNSQLQELKTIFNQTFPDFIYTYLFEEENRYRRKPYNVSDFKTMVDQHFDIILSSTKLAFHHHWPEEANVLVTEDALQTYIQEMSDRLQLVLDQMHKRLVWAVNTQDQLLHKQSEGLLEPEEETLLRRCKQYIRSLRKQSLPNYTLNALATEGFLPGYGMYEHGVTAFAKQSMGAADGQEIFQLGRAASIALREFIPGNLIYANNSRFRVNLYHLPVGEQEVEPVEFAVDLKNERILDTKDRQELASYGDVTMTEIIGIPICDLDITYFSRISDEEDYRFRMPVKTLGYTKDEHRGIRTYSIVGKYVQHRFGQQTRLVNIGASDLVAKGEMGYPVCTVCGATRSPYASESDLEHFETVHKERHNTAPQRIAFYTDTQVDGLMFRGLNSEQEAINLGEALRIGAARVLEMDVEDLQILLMVEGNESHVTFLYDPMPGGSGLLQQMIQKWEQVIEAARDILDDCPGRCESSCYDCLRSYRNSYYHKILNRFEALELIEQYNGRPKFEHEVDARIDLKAFSDKTGTYRGEKDLRQMLKDAGFPAFDHEQEIEIGEPFRRTRPDLYFEDPAGLHKVAIYLDGLSKSIHGDPETHRKDQMIRMQLESQGIDVIEIARSDLDDPEAMRLHYKRIAYKLGRKDILERD